MPNTPIQLLQPPAYSYYVAPYPILSFMYGLYCDVIWSKANFEAWKASQVDDTKLYEYEAGLDRYPHMPHGARVLISTTVVEEAPQDPEGHPMPTPELAERMWPYLVQELTFDPAQAVSPPSDPQRESPTLDGHRPALSGVALIYLRNLTREQAEQALKESPLKDKLVEVARTRMGPGQPLENALLALKDELVRDFTVPPAVW
jgi:hypothetical protein